MFLQKLIPGLASISLVMISLLLITACSPGGNNQQANSSNANSNAGSAPVPTSTSGAPGAKLNINTATSADLLRTIPNLGNRMVHEFEEYRPYKSIQQFRKEIGKYVDQNQVAEYEKFIYVPIDENQSDAATLQQIPGLDAGEAQDLTAGRPYASRDAFLAKVAEKVSAADLAIAKTYLAQP